MDDGQERNVLENTDNLHISELLKPFFATAQQKNIKIKKRSLLYPQNKHLYNIYLSIHLEKSVNKYNLLLLQEFPQKNTIFKDSAGNMELHEPAHTRRGSLAQALICSEACENISIHIYTTIDTL